MSISGDGSDAVAKDANGNVVSWDASAVTTKQNELQAVYKLDELRTERNRLLAETDWWDMSDTPTMTAAQITYRQALRNLPTTATPQLDENGNLTNIIWPTPPS